MRSADCSCTRLGKTEVQKLSFADEPFNRASHIFDQHFRINAVLVIEIDAIGFSPKVEEQDAQPLHGAGTPQRVCFVRARRGERPARTGHIFG